MKFRLITTDRKGGIKRYKLECSECGLAGFYPEEKPSECAFCGAKVKKAKKSEQK